MSSPGLRFERADGLARLTFDRPDAGNSLDVPLARALMEAANECDEDDTIRCVLLTGAGRFFCAGGDVKGFADAGDNISVHLKELTAYIHMAIARFAHMGKPLVTAINGPAVGAGMSLAILGDIVLTARSAHFTLAYGAIGLTPDGGATWLLPRLVGLRRAQEMALTNRRIAAEEAVSIGLATRVVDDDALAAETSALIAQLVGSATYALGRTRNLLQSSFHTGLEEQMEMEARAIADAGRQAEGREGIAAFLAKRKPNFAI